MKPLAFIPLICLVSLSACFNEVENLSQGQKDAGTGKYASSGSFIPGSGTPDEEQDIDKVYGAPDGELLSLGNHGSLDVSFDDLLIYDNMGGDIRVYGSFDSGEKATVYGSLDGGSYEIIQDISEGNDVVEINRGGFTKIMFLRVRDSGVGDGIDIDAFEILNAP